MKEIGEFRPSVQYSIATLKYRNELEKKVGPKIHTVKQYEDAFYGNFGPRVNINEKVPEFPHPQEKLNRYRKLGFEPVYVSKKLTGFDGVDILTAMLHDKIEINNIPNFINEFTEGGWYYAQTDPKATKEQLSKMPQKEAAKILKEIKPGDFPTFALTAVRKKAVENKYLNEFDIDKNLETITRLSGSIICQKDQPIDLDNAQVLGVYITHSGTFFTSKQDKKQVSPGIIDFKQIPIKPRFTGFI